MSSVTRIITPHDEEVAKRLRKYFEHKKATEGLTQELLGRALGGMKQPTVAQYLSGKIALRNAQTLCAFATALGVAPEDLDPKLDIRFPTVPPTKKLTANIPTFTLDGDTASAIQPFKKLTVETAYAITLDARYEPLFPRNTKIIADPNSVIKKHQLIALQRNGAFFIYKLSNITSHSLIVYSADSGTLRETLTRKHAEHTVVDTIAPEGFLTIPLNSIDSAHKIRGIEFPD